MEGQSSSTRRDWMAIFLQAIGIIVVIGIPIFIWGVNVNAEMMVTQNRLQQIEHDESVTKTYEDLTTTQMLELNRQLATIAAQVTDIRDMVKMERDGVGGKR